ncbi:hypothetical protein Clocel_0744 [Clostridium cellulovorans 743B]|uniref:Uncharacterized protein n=1 Tax=Clostridium cellulovorans (strain ATCC 35296 / DSM 3052 / OCM 3 / 743B) TaxID=573061 RepID=D9SSB8_CLOC7|nr:hypothetical protein Clocel_0744 [Clostridium cellulovorans 743B]
MYYWIILLIIYIVYITLKVKEKSFNRKADLMEKPFNIETLEKYCEDMFKFYNVNPIKIINNKYFSYNKAKNIITIRAMKEYNFLDTFICFHEIGHYISSKSKYIRIIDNILIILFMISRICLTPFLIIFGVYCVVKSYNPIPSNIYFFINILYLSISVIRIITIPFIEGRANYFAKKFFIGSGILSDYKKQEEPIKIIKTSCLIAQLNQMIICILYTYIVICLFYIVNVY